MKRLEDAYQGILEASNPVLRVTNEYVDALQLLQQAFDAGVIKSQEEMTIAVAAATKTMDEGMASIRGDAEETNKVFQDLALTMASDVGSAFRDFATGAATGEEAMGRLLQSISDVVFEMLVMAPILAGLKSLFGGQGFSAGFTGFFAPGRATGGPVSAGSPYIVGERGPELFVPASNGNINPNASPQIMVEVNTLPGTTANVTQGEGGGLTIDIVEMHVAASLASGGNAISRAAESAYPSLRRGSM